MKRLFAYLGLTLICALTVVFYLGNIGAIFIWVFSLIVAVVGLFVKRFANHRVALVFISVVAVLACLYSMVFTTFIYEPKCQLYNNKRVTLTAVIKDIPHLSHNTYCYEVESLEINGKEENLKILLKSPMDIDATYYDIIVADVELTMCEYDYHKSKGYYFTAQSPDYYLNCYKQGESEKDIWYLPVYIKEKLLYSVSTLIPGEEGNLCKAVALGDKYSLSEDTLDMFDKTGLTYLIVVSGMHMSIVAGFLLLLFKKLPKSTMCNILRYGVTIIFVLLFMAITGFTPSVVRSGVTVIITYCGIVFGRKSDPLNSLGFAATLIALGNPYSVGDIGMLFSFGSVFGIITMYMPFMSILKEKYYGSKWKSSVYHQGIKYKISRKFTDFIFAVVDSFVLSVSAVSCVTVISIIFFGKCGPLTVFISLFVTPVIACLLICALISSFLWYIPLISNFAYVFVLVAFYVAKWILWVVKLGSKLPLVEVYVNRTYFIIWLCVAIVSVFVAYLMKNKRKYLKIAIAYSVILSLFIIPTSKLMNFEKTNLNVYKSGVGTTVSITSGETMDVLSCGGTPKYISSVLEDLREENCKLNFLLVPSAQNFEGRYATSILKEFDCNSVMLYYRYNTDEETYRLAKQIDNYREFYSDDTFEIDLNNGIKDVVMNVSNHTYQYIYNDKTSVLILSYKGNCEKIPENYRVADVVIMCSECKNTDLLKYNDVVWASDEDVPDNLHNVTVVNDNVIISFD